MHTSQIKSTIQLQSLAVFILEGEMTQCALANDIAQAMMLQHYGTVRQRHVPLRMQTT